jgi:hypothetical protein
VVRLRDTSDLFGIALGVTYNNIRNLQAYIVTLLERYNCTTQSGKMLHTFGNC